MKAIEIKKTGAWDEDSYTYETYDMIVDGREVGGAQVAASEAGAYVERIDINENERGQGYGTALLRELSGIYGGVTVAPDSEDSQRLYDRLGSDVTDRGDNWAIDQGFGVYEI